jgi:hypothetical protein
MAELLKEELPVGSAAHFHIPFVSKIILEIEGSVLYSGAFPLRILGEFHN